MSNTSYLRTDQVSFKLQVRMTGHICPVLELRAPGECPATGEFKVPADSKR